LPALPRRRKPLKTPSKNKLLTPVFFVPTLWD
jgi:hypothetical protein